ncbi:MAG TPA: hypothetical protein VF209_03920 [Patescibacteria group bacterium]
MLEMHNEERSGYKRIGGRSYDASYSSEGRNAQMKELWEILAVASHGTLTPSFEELYWFGGMLSPAYDIKGELGNFPPSGTFQSFDQELHLLLPVYKSMQVRHELRPAKLGIWSKEKQVGVARIFNRNLDYLNTPLENTHVYAVMRRPDGTPFTSKYANPQEFRGDYFRVITGEQGEVLVVTNNPEEALEAYRTTQAEKDIERITSQEVQAPLLVKVLPKFLQSVWTLHLAGKAYPTIEDTLK